VKCDKGFVGFNLNLKGSAYIWDGSLEALSRLKTLFSLPWSGLECIVLVLVSVLKITVSVSTLVLFLLS